MTEIEKAYGKLLESSEKARAFVDAVLELGQMETFIDFELIKDPALLKKRENLSQYLHIYDLLRCHGTVSELCRALRDEIETISNAVDLMDKSLHTIKTQDTA